MKRILLTWAGLLALAGSIGAAQAADLSRPPPPAAAPYYSPAYNWTGFYAGLNGGGAFGDSTWSAIATTYNVSGGMIGGQLGYNWQMGQFVWGLEGDADWASLSGNTTSPACFPAIAPCFTKSDFLATFRGRLGVAFDRFMPYATGGLAIGNIRTSTTTIPGVDLTNVGWTVGAGLEFAIAGPWTAKVEYLFVDLGNVGCGFACGFAGPGNTVSLTENVIRAGINYRF
jgi:outer membrane immunogenic protein